MKTSLRTISCIAILLGTNGFVAAQLPPAAAKPVDFDRDIEPLFRTRCNRCHGAQQQLSGLRLDRAEDAMRGGYSGAVIQPGKSAESRLIRLVAGAEKGAIMPLGKPRLTPDEVGILRAWIDQGAKWPQTTTTDSAPKSSHWAFQPIRRPQSLPVRNQSWVKNPVDSFVLARLEAEHIAPSPEAGKVTLIRRLSLDLTGLPPTPEQVSAFLSDATPGAYERVVDSLLDSPHYGEKWGRYWLDLARYADSDGYRQDAYRPHAFRYRDWVIESLNRDKPFDQFTIEQIAGDLLPNATTEQKIATGFHRNTLSNREGGTDTEQFRFEQVLDRTNTVGTVWLGLTVGCAQCHDHKYDPISQKDYYRFFAFFNNAEEVNIDAPRAGELGPYLKALPAYQRARADLLTKYRVPELQRPWELKLIEAAANPGKWTDWDHALDELRTGDGQPVYNQGDKMLRTAPERRAERQKKLLTDHFIDNYHRVITKEEQERLKFRELRKELNALEAAFPALSEAQVIVTESEPRETHVYLRGSYRAKGIAVQPGTLSVLPAMAPDSEPTRLTLAKWLVSNDNPLTARVTVNRVWQELFGRGLVRSSENFGAQGEKPSHPDLLDWLASDFIDHGWSFKHAVKTIVMSAAYRQSSAARPEANADALVACQARLRLPAELIRDSALAASGLLYPAIGGSSMRPPQPDGSAKSGKAKWPESTGKERYRRGLYIQYQRMSPYPQLANFDMPGGYRPVCRRDRSNTALQSLNLLNDPVFFDAAQALAVRILTESAGGFRQRLDYGFRLVLARSPEAVESDSLETSFERQKQILRTDPAGASAILPADIGVDRTEAAAWVGLSSVLLNLDEFITRE
jgi:hypothetical protein